MTLKLEVLINMGMRTKQRLMKADHTSRYGLRKLSWGLASVMLGATITFIGTNPTAHAAESGNPAEAPTQTAALSMTGSSSASVGETKEGTVESSVSSQHVLGQAATPDESKPGEDSGQQIQVAPIQTTVGVVPDAKAAIPNWNYDQGITDAVWDQQPDVSRPGQTTGRVRLTFDPNYGYETPSRLMNVSVYVTARDETIDYQETGVPVDDMVSNYVQYVDEKTGKILRVEKYTGAKETSTNEWPKPIDSDYVRQAFHYAGYDLVNDSNTTFNDALTLGNSDQYFTLYLTPVTDGQTGSGQEVEPFIRNDVQGLYLDFTDPNNLPNPVVFIANWNQLPKGSKAIWKVKPSFDLAKDEYGNYVNYYPITPYPVIEVSYGGKTKDFSYADTPLSSMIMLPMGSEYPVVNGNVTVPVNGELPPIEKVITYTDPAVAPYSSYYWVVKPNLSHVGVTYGALCSDQNLNTLYVMVQVVPAPVNPDQPKQPANPERPVIPDHPEQPGQPTTPGQNSQTGPSASGEVSELNVQSSQNNHVAQAKQQLPQTGSKSGTGLVLLGLTSLLSMLGLAGRKKNRN